jgi:gamma-glutamylputrescine oxidase
MRRDQRWLEAQVGQADAHKLWDFALHARDHLDWLITQYDIDCDLRLGLLHVNHKARYTADSEQHVLHLNKHYGYESIRSVDRQTLRTMLASEQYHSGTVDQRGGHLHALNFSLGIARAADSHGARLYEGCEVRDIRRIGSRFQVCTAQGQVDAAQVVLACNGYLRKLSRAVHQHVMPINNFIAVTEPLGALSSQLIPSQCAVSDSRFVVRYFRMTPDHRLLFGGGENYSFKFPKDIGSTVRPHLESVFPQLKSVRFDYTWGGTLAITPTRMPYVREVERGVINASGFSGLGVVLAPYTGKVVADALLGDRVELDLLGRVPVPTFPGGPALRWPTLVAGMSFSALRDFL